MFNDNTDPMLDTNMVDRLEQKVHMMEELGIDDPITFSSRALIQATFPHSKKHADEVGTLVAGVQLSNPLIHWKKGGGK